MEDLEGLDECPEEGPDALPLGEELDEPHHPEESEEGDGDHVVTRLERVGGGEDRGERVSIVHLIIFRHNSIHLRLGQLVVGSLGITAPGMQDLMRLCQICDQKYNGGDQQK